eukprot:gene2622-3035_t
MKDRITLRYEYYQRGEAAHEDDVTPEDSVSQIYSTDQSCKSSRSSVRSGDLLLQGKRLTNATRRASLMAEASFIKLKQSLTSQKIRLQQELDDLDMKMQFRKLEAEDEVFDEFETSHTQSAPPHKPERLMSRGEDRVSDAPPQPVSQCFGLPVMSRGENCVSDAPPQPVSRPSAIVDQSVHMPDLKIPQKFMQSCDLSVSPEDTITTREDLQDSAGYPMDKRPAMFTKQQAGSRAQIEMSEEKAIKRCCPL